MLAKCSTTELYLKTGDVTNIESQITHRKGEDNTEMSLLKPDMLAHL